MSNEINTEILAKKAKEIFNNMKGFKVSHSHSKKCAELAVIEIIHATRGMVDKDSGYSTDKYWHGVLIEIEKIELPKKSKKSK